MPSAHLNQQFLLRSLLSSCEAKPIPAAPANPVTAASSESLKTRPKIVLDGQNNSSLRINQSAPNCRYALPSSTVLRPGSGRWRQGTPLPSEIGRPLPTSGERSSVDAPGPLNIKYLLCFCSRLRHRSNFNGCVADMHLGPLDSFITRRIFPRLVRSAYTESELRSFISETRFQSASIRADGIEFEVWLNKAARNGRNHCD